MRRESLLVPLLVVALAAVACVHGLWFAANVGSPGGLYAALAPGSIALAAVLAAVGLWRETRWAPAAVLALGAVYASTQLYEAFVLGVRPWLVAVLMGLVALLAAIFVAARSHDRRA